LYALRGATDAAREQLAAIEYLRTSEDEQNRVGFSTAEIAVLFSEGAMTAVADQAEWVLPTAIAMFGLWSEDTRRAWTQSVDAALAAGRYEVVAALVELIAARPRGHLPPFLRAQLARAEALLATHEGHPERTEPGLQSAVDQLAALGYPYWHALAQLDLAAWLRSEGRGGDAEPLTQEALAVLESLKVDARVVPTAGARRDVS
jgi:hypothetical protein